MGRNYFEAKYSGIKDWDLDKVNGFAKDLGLGLGSYEKIVDAEVFYNIKTGKVRPAGSYIVNYCIDNDGVKTYVITRKKNLSEVVEMLVNDFVA